MRAPGKQACAHAYRALAQRGRARVDISQERVTAYTLSYARAFPPQLSAQIASRPTVRTLSMHSTMTVRASARPVVAAAPSRPAFRAPRAVVRPSLFARAGPPTVRSLPAELCRTLDSSNPALGPPLQRVWSLGGSWAMRGPAPPQDCLFEGASAEQPIKRSSSF